MDSLDGLASDKRGILFVDDEEKALKYFERAYGVDFKVYTARTVAMANEILETHGKDIAILITDKRMPKGDGLQLICDVKRKNPEITRLLTTAYHDAEDVIRAVNEGEIYRYVPKPWDIESLRDELMAAVKFYDAKSHESKVKMRLNKTFLLAHITNELEGPLHNISLGVQDLRQKLPQLLAKVQSVSPLSKTAKGVEREMAAVLAVPADIEFCLKEIHAFMDILLANVTANDVEELEFNVYSASDCIVDALQLYPIDEAYVSRVHLKVLDDFYFRGSDELIILVMFNLLRNALYSLNEAGKGEIHISINQNAEYNSICVRDTGQGIAEADKNYIFDEYFTTKLPGGGLGLGLSFCKKAIESMGGTISCKSLDGEYCEIMIHLPKCAEHAREVRIESKHVH